MIYRIFASLAEEDNDGWVRLWETGELKTRKILRIVCGSRTVFCVCRTINDNFLGRYNQGPRVHIQMNQRKALIISEWYRDALGGFETQTDQTLVITPAKIPIWRELRATSHHPDIVVRLATYLGVLGAWLGLVGLVPAVLEITDVEKTFRLAVIVSIAVLGAILGVLVCRGVARLK